MVYSPLKYRNALTLIVFVYFNKERESERERSSLFILHTICCKCNCLANLGLEKDDLCVTTQQEWNSSHILTQESQARMNDFDNATGLPATRRQFLVTTERQGDEKILGRLIENTPSSKRKRSD